MSSPWRKSENRGVFRSAAESTWLRRRDILDRTAGEIAAALFLLQKNASCGIAARGFLTGDSICSPVTEMSEDVRCGAVRGMDRFRWGSRNLPEQHVCDHAYERCKECCLHFISLVEELFQLIILYHIFLAAASKRVLV